MKVGASALRAGASRPFAIRTVTQGIVLSERDSVPHVLLSVRSDVRGWELPGGTLEPGEDVREALAREIWEETGLRVEIGRHVGDYRRTGFLPHLARVYVCRVVSGDPTPSRETLDVAWFPLDQIPVDLLPWYRQPVADGLEPEQEPVERREHQGLVAILASVRIDLRMRWNGI